VISGIDEIILRVELRLDWTVPVPDVAPTAHTLEYRSIFPKDSIRSRRIPMGWFGGGSSDESSSSSASDSGFSDDSALYSSSPNMYGSSVSSGSSGLQEFQEFSVALQQQVLVQSVITDLTHKAFEKCCTSATTSNTLTGKEAACISAITNKWLDSNEFLAGRLQRKSQQSSGGSPFG
jgi:Tim10/DDP family zinc finger